MHTSTMPVPTWDSDSLYEVDHHLVTNGTVVPDDIWNKFDLDCPVIDNYHCRGKADSSSSADLNSSCDQSCSYSWSEHQDAPMSTICSNSMVMMQLERYGCPEDRKIRHHDCMWAGLCISKEHNRAPSAKRVVNQRIPAGRSILIPKNNVKQVTQQQVTQQPQQSLLTGDNNYQSTCRSRAAKQKNLESDGDSTRPPTPQSSIPEESSETESEESEESDEVSEEEEEEEDECPIFRHDNITINGLISARASEVTGQQIQRRPAFSNYDRRKEDDKLGSSNSKHNQHQISKSSDSHLMSDHCYHLNQQPQPTSANKKLEHLGVQTPSDSGESEEEIDVVNFDKPVRPESTALTLLNPAEQYHLNQLTVNTLSAYKDRKNKSANNCAGSHEDDHDIENVVPSIPQNPTPRPRGRPPLNPANRKRPASTALTNEPKATKRARNSNKSNYQKKSNAVSPQKQQLKILPPSPSKSSASSDDEPDTEKRSMHNNMERQRRVELRQAFEMLRLLVPALVDKEKAPKVAILRQSAQFCDKLGDIDAAHQQTISELKREQERLRARLSSLRRNFAMQR